MILSKKASLFDILGKLNPITAGLSLDLRKAMKETDGWDDPVSDGLRYKWLNNVLTLEQLRGIKFSMARIPENAVSTDMDLIAAGNTAQGFIKVTGVGVREAIKKVPNFGHCQKFF